MTPIRPRTPSERRAFVAGYASCLETIENAGLKAARDHLKLSVDSEERMMPSDEQLSASWRGSAGPEERL